MIPRRMRQASRLVALPIALSVALAACGSGGDSPASTSSEEGGVEDFFADSEITLIVSVPPGGGFDTWARLFARHMGQYIPGEPDIVVENMPGGNHQIALNHLSNVAAKDGSVIGTAEAVVFPQLLGAEGVRFDFGDFQYLGMPDAPANMVLVTYRERGVTSFEDHLGRDSEPLVVSASAGEGGITSDPVILAREVLDANIDVVSGYEGTQDRALAVQQGEADAFMTSVESLGADFADDFESGRLFPILQLAEPGSSSYLEDVPTIQSFAKTDEDRQLIAVGSTLRAYVRPYFVHGDVPTDRYEALKDAWERTVADPAFIAEAKGAGRTVNPVSGEELKEVYTTYLDDTSPAVVERLKLLLKP